VTKNELLLREWPVVVDAMGFDGFDKYVHDDCIAHAPMGMEICSLAETKELWGNAVTRPSVRRWQPV